jgi:hypothetical protein
LLEQPAAVAAMLNVVLCEVVVLLVKVPEIGDPEPVAPIPLRLVVLLLFQVNVVPEILLGFEMTIFVIDTPEHIV